MDAEWHMLLSGTLTFGVPLALAVRELVVLRRPPGGAWPGDGPKTPAPLPMPPQSPRSLPDCLIPRIAPTPVKARAPELV